MTPVFWAALLLLLGLLLLMTEIFVPSGGVLGFLAITAIIGAIVMAFLRGGPATGTMFFIVTMIAVPVVLAGGFHFLPRTPMGKRLLPPIPTSAEVLPDSPQRRMLRELVGKLGRAKTVMLPSGAVTIEGRTIDAISEGMPIEAGQLVRVISVQGTSVYVQPVEEDATTPRERDDILSQPFDRLGLDPFEEPLV